jgi:hypothetical protein
MKDKINYKYPHQFASNHRFDVLNSQICNCFHCLAQFTPSRIEEWIDENENDVGQTALCPFCGIDSVIGDKSIVLSKEFICEMEKFWFNDINI